MLNINTPIERLNEKTRLKRPAYQRSSEIEKPAEKPSVSDRRRKPERRRNRLDNYQGQNRRQVPDRRKPQLLNAKDGSPDSIETARGRHIDTSI